MNRNVASKCTCARKPGSASPFAKPAFVFICAKARRSGRRARISTTRRKSCEWASAPVTAATSSGLIPSGHLRRIFSSRFSFQRNSVSRIPRELITKAIWHNKVESDDTVVVEANHYFPRDSLKEYLYPSSTRRAPVERYLQLQRPRTRRKAEPRRSVALPRTEGGGRGDQEIASLSGRAFALRIDFRIP